MTMQRLLLDAHTLLWWLADDPALGTQTREAIADGRNRVYVSAASIWEIGIKRELGKFDAPQGMDRIVEEERFIPLPVTLHHAEAASLLPHHHRDPFDRMLIAQAQSEGLTLVTADGQMGIYGVRILAAGE